MHRAMTLIARSLFLTALLACAPVLAQSLGNERLDRVVAVVNDEVILQSELDRAIGNIQAQYASRSDQLPPRDVLERQVLDRIILIKVQAQRASETGLRISEPEIDTAIAAVAEQNSMSLDQLRASLERDGFAYSEFRETMREELLLQRMRQRFTQTRVSVSDIEIDNALASGAGGGGEVRLGHILVSVPDNADAQTIRTGQEKADGIVKLIAEGMEFSAAAIRYSNAPNALEGGELGWRAINEIPGAFTEVVNGLSEGQVSPAIRGPAGFHILKLYERRAESVRMVQEMNARHIMIKVDELTDSAAAQARITALHRQLVDGADFAELAREHSQDFNTAPLGGDMGWFPIDGYGSGVASTVAAMEDGAISEPFQTDVGWHVLQRLGTRQQDRTDLIKRNQASEMVRNRKAEEEYERYLRQLRDEAYIENRLAQAG
jgi:peptidyl-prolyl cis-trans isomerase SurA